MSRTILTRVDGWTPVIDDLVKQTSLITAVVFGRMWRFCQMKDGVCNASLEKIAIYAGIDRATVMRHAKILAEAGYLEDMTPDLRNRPHTYRDTGKAGLHIGVSANAGVAESNTSVAESKLKIVVKKELTTTDDSKEIFRTYESEIGAITPHIANLIGLWIDDPTCPNEWISEVMKIASSLNIRNWAYCEAILKRWMVEGKTSVKKEPSGPKYSNKQADLLKQLETA